MTILIPELSMTETLFGGLLAAVILFFATRRLGLPNFWAGVLSGLLPFLFYLIYISQHWEGGDVLAIHFALYLANAGVLTVLGGMQQKKQRMHWAPRLIVTFFIVLVIVNAVLLSLASRGLPSQIANWLLPNPDRQQIHTTFPGTVPHDRNKSYQGHLQQVEQQRELGWQVGVQGLDALQVGQAQEITIVLRDRAGQPVTAADVRLGFWRLANSRDDQSMQLAETEPGQYSHTLTLSDAGRWLFELNIYRGEDHYRQQQQLFLDD